MFTVELYAGVRRAVMVDGLSRREAAKRFGVHRNTITKMLQFSVTPSDRRRERRTSKKLGPFMAWIDKVLEDDQSVHKKQRHTAQRIFERPAPAQKASAGPRRGSGPSLRILATVSRGISSQRSVFGHADAPDDAFHQELVGGLVDLDRGRALR